MNIVRELIGGKYFVAGLRQSDLKWHEISAKATQRTEQRIAKFVLEPEQMSNPLKVIEL